MITMFIQIILIIFTIFGNGVKSSPIIEPSPSAIDETNYRLPKSIKPTNYLISISVEKDFFTSNYFKGTSQITFDVLESGSEIKLHSKDLTIGSVKLVDENLQEIGSTFSNSDPDTDIFTILSGIPLEIGKKYTVVIDYEGYLSLIDMHGFYKSSYLDENNEIQYLAATQFEATHARRAFPCFDEPEFKAIFEFIIGVPKEYTVLANTPADPEPIGDVTTYYTAETPIMSTYLNAFIISKFTCDPSTESLTNNIIHRVCSRDDAKDSRTTALEYGPKLMNVLEEFTAKTYSASNIGKMDQVAIPDFSAGAMENWGLVTYRETGLLWTKEESNNNYKQRLAMVIAHEFTHMWFGNLVTMNWWSDLFLNEGFARYFQYFATAKVEPFWQLDKQFIIEQLQSAFVIDASTSSKALSSNVITAEEISGKFDSISYNKGACILRMVKYVMGEDNFQTGVRSYLTNYEYKNPTAAQFWASLDGYVTLPTGLNLIQVVNEWTFEAGYPLVTVAVSGKNIIISQERFLYSGDDTTKNKWYIPITYTRASDVNKFENTETQIWLKPSDNTVTIENALESDDSWIILNNQQIGYYRVNYDDTLWTRINLALKRDYFHGINSLARSQIVDDSFNLARSGILQYSQVFNLIRFLSNDTDYYSWYSAFQGFTYVQRNIGSLSLRNILNNFILELLEKVYNSVPFDQLYTDSQIYTLKQALVLNWACKIGNQDCINKALTQFELVKQSSPLDPNLRSVVYCTALRESNENWDFLWQKYISSKVSTEQITILSSFGCSQDETLLKDFLTTVFKDNSVIRRQDTSTAISSIYNNNPAGPLFVSSFLVENYESVKTFYGQNEKPIFSLFNTLIERFTTNDEIDKLKQLIVSNDATLSSDAKTTLETALTSATTHLQNIIELENHLTNYFTLDASEPDAAISLKIQYSFIILSFIICYYFI